jgi:hypothetical protein
MTILLCFDILKHITRNYCFLNWRKKTNIEYVSEHQVNASLFLIKCHAMRTYGEVEEKLNTFLNLGTGWKRVVTLALQPLISREESSQYLLNRKLGGPPEAIWTLWRKVSAHIGYRTSVSRSFSLVPIVSVLWIFILPLVGVTYKTRFWIG